MVAVLVLSNIGCVQFVREDKSPISFGAFPNEPLTAEEAKVELNIQLIEKKDNVRGEPRDYRYRYSLPKGRYNLYFWIEEGGKNIEELKSNPIFVNKNVELSKGTIRIQFPSDELANGWVTIDSRKRFMPQHIMTGPNQAEFVTGKAEVPLNKDVTLLAITTNADGRHNGSRDPRKHDLVWYFKCRISPATK